MNDDAHNQLRKAVYYAENDWLRENRGRKFNATIYVNYEFFSELRGCEGFFQEQHGLPLNEYKVAGWPLYVVNDETHPRFKIYIEAIKP